VILCKEVGIEPARNASHGDAGGPKEPESQQKSLLSSALEIMGGKVVEE